MLSRNLKRALLDTRWPLPPTFLLPWAANLTTVSHTTESSTQMPPSMSQATSRPSLRAEAESASAKSSIEANHPAPNPPAASNAKPLPPPNSSTSPSALSSSVRELLPLLKAQSPHYITIHIHGKPYLITQGDTIRLPFFMHGVEPGDVLRLNRAVNIGSRDYTLKAAAAPPRLKSPTTDTRNILDPTTGTLASHSPKMPSPSVESSGDAIAAQASRVLAPHFVPHLEQGKHSYLDERLFVCRAVVMGVESEPLRIKEKTKRRQRKVKKVKSKHRFTILRVKEVRVKDVEELDSEEQMD